MPHDPAAAHARLAASAARLAKALERVLTAFETDVKFTPDVTIRQSWDGNMGAITAAREALKDAGGGTL